jgi:hypothetical protein
VVSGRRRAEERLGPGVVRTVLGLVAGSGPGARLPGLPRVGKGATSGCKTLGNRGRFAHNGSDCRRTAVPAGVAADARREKIMC